MAPKNLEQYRKSQKYLVAEQQGWTRSLVGLFFAIILGLMIKAQIVPSKVLQLVREATVNADPKLDIQFSSARVSLSDGLFPELAVVVQDLVVTPKDDCWGGTNLKVDQIKVPIKFRDAVRGIFSPRVVEIGSAAIDIEVEKLERCGQSQIVNDSSVNKAPVVPVSAEASHPFAKNSASKKSAGLDLIEIKSLQVNLIAKQSHELSIRQVKVIVESHEPRKLTLSGFVKFTSSDKIFDLASGGRLLVVYDEMNRDLAPVQGPLNKFPLVANLSGNWFEGSYLAKLSLDPVSQNFQLYTEAKYLPLLQILPILKKYNVIKTDLNGRKSWGTFKFQVDGDLKNLNQAKISGSELKVEGDFGEVYVPSIDIQQFRPTIFTPVNVALKNFDFNELMIFMNKQHPSQTLGNLGKFYGTLTIKSARHLMLSGEHSGLEFWFSNKGERAIQPISLILLEAEWKDDNWNLSVNRIQPTGGLFEGKIKVKANNEWTQVGIDANIDELILSSAVQDVMSANGRIGTIYGDLGLNIVNGKASGIKGKIGLDEGMIENIEFKKLSMKFTPKQSRNGDHSFELLTQVKEVKVPSSREFVAKLGLYQDASQKADFRDLRIVAETEDFRTLKWDLNSVRAGTLSVASIGSWDQEGKLRGDVRIRSGSRVIKNFAIEGHRDAPIFRQKN